MKFRVHEITDLKGILVAKIKEKIDDFKPEESFPNIGDIQITGTHPFSILFNNKSSDMAGVLPSISVSLSNRAQSHETLGYGNTPFEIEQSDIDRWTDDELESRAKITPDSTLLAVKVAFDALGVDEKMFARRRSTFKDEVAMIDIWVHEDATKDILFEIVDSILFDALEEFTLEPIGLTDIVITGDGDSEYNYNFGPTIYGARITFACTREKMSWLIDTDLKSLASATVTPTFGTLNNS